MNTWYNRIHVNIGGKSRSLFKHLNLGMCLVVVVSMFLGSFFQLCDPSFKDHGYPHVCLIKSSNSGKDEKIGSMNMQHALRRNERLINNNQVAIS